MGSNNVEKQHVENHEHEELIEEFNNEDSESENE